MATFPVKHFHSGMRGAPVVSGSAGAMIGLLDGCLINGFGSVSVTSINVSGGVATAAVASGDSFDADAIISVAGASPSALNGEARILSSGGAWFTFATAAADGSASGTITAKYAPVGGWEKTYSGTNKAVYRSIDLEANGHYLRVDDSNTTYANVFGYESMSDVDTGVARFPSMALWSNNDARWWKAVSSGPTALPWRFFSDSRFFQPAIQVITPSATVYPKHAMGFGDLLSLASGGDAWNTLLTCAGVTIASHIPSSALFNSGTPYAQNYGRYCARSVSGMGSAVAMCTKPYMGTPGKSSGADDTFGSGISAVDGRLLVSRMNVSEGVVMATAPRADIPGGYYVPQKSLLGAGIADGDKLAGAGDLAGRVLMVVAAGSAAANAAADGFYLVDITGPWR